MRFWSATDGLDGAREDVRQIRDLLDQSFRARGEEVPRMLGVATCATDADEHIYETFLELAPGVVLSVGYGSPEDLDGDEIPKWKAASAAEEAAPAIRSYLGIGVDRLSDLLHDLRLRARRIIAGSADRSGTGRLVNLRLTASGWHAPGQCHVRMRLEGLDGRLRPVTEQIQVDDLNTFDAHVESWARGTADRDAARRAFALQGASGSIDLLTLNAIWTFADPQAWVRSLAHPQWPGSPDHVIMFAEAGAYRSHGRDISSALSWNRDKIRYPMLMPSTLLVACAGRPVTDIIEHPLLSREMTVREATCTVVGKNGVLTLEIDQPRLLFCVDSGRMWSSRDATPPDGAVTGITSGE